MSNKPDPKPAADDFDSDDTVPLRQIQVKPAPKSASEPTSIVGGFDPYSSAAPKAPAKKPRRTLDDMRRLSEEIKQSRQK